MDFTPHLEDISEDSGCLTATFEFGETSSNLHYVVTPSTTSNNSRKRKLSHNARNQSRSYLELSHREVTESPAVFDAISAGSNFLSSTLNESLSKSLEKCNLGNYMPNFYVERSLGELDSEQCSKRCKLDDSPKYQPKTRSAPSTPTKHLEEEELYPKGKSRSEQLNYFNLTPAKNSSLYKRSKLGSPERLELLYPNIRPTPSPRKIKTPEQLREFSKKINSPPKRRLFESSQLVERKIFRKVDYDPISVFLVKNDFRHIVAKIFEFLSDGDLCTVSKVSKSWKRALTADYKAFPRYYTYSQEFNSNKENILGSFRWYSTPKSPPVSPERDNFQRCTKIVSRLSPSQSLQKCPQCMEPAVIQKSVSQCQNLNCEYIYCMKCLSFSTSGPENFVDKCHTSELILENKQKSNRCSLYDMSNGGNDPPYFLLNESLGTPRLKYDSSGYLSESDMSPARKQTPTTLMEIKNFSTLTNANRSDTSKPSRKTRRSSLLSVVSSSSTPKIIEIVEPSSPPKIKLVACSKQSKKNLKRLHL